MATIRMSANTLTHRVEYRGGKALVVLSDRGNELEIEPGEGADWIAIWALSSAFDTMAAQVKIAELTGDYRGDLAPAAVLQSPLGGPASGAG